MPEHQDTTVDGQLDMIHACVSLGVAVVSVLVFFQCWKRYMKRQTREHNKTYTACSSPDCVRCTKYNTIRLDAAKKAKECYTEETPHSDRLCSAMEGNAKFQHTSQAPNVFYVPNLQASPWWDISSFKLDVKLLENNCRQICDEMCELYYDDAQCHNGWTSNITAEGSWNTYYFYNQGQEIISNCDRCPKTYQVIKQLTCFMDGCVFGNALFSVLDPGSFITEHCGPTNIRIRCHLGKLFIYVVKRGIDKACTCIQVIQNK